MKWTICELRMQEWMAARCSQFYQIVGLSQIHNLKYTTGLTCLIEFNFWQIKLLDFLDTVDTSSGYEWIVNEGNESNFLIIKWTKETKGYTK